MIFYDYIIRPDGEVHRLRQTESDTLDPVVSLVWPTPFAEAHKMAGDLSRCWAAAWLLDRSADEK